MRKKKKKQIQIQIGNIYLNRKNQQCKILGKGRAKSRGLFIVAVLDQPSEVEKDGCFHYAANPDELTLPRSPKQIIKNIKEDLKQLCRQAKQRREEVEFQMRSLKKCKELIKPRFGSYRLNPKRFGQMTSEKISKKFRKAAREIGRQVVIEFKNLKIGRAAARSTTSEVLDMAERVIQSLIAMEVNLESLPKQVEGMQYRAKLYNYERRREIELYNKTLGKDLTTSQKPKDRGQKKGAEIMASKKGDKKKVSELLRKLEKSSDAQEKREIRAELRKLGHKGGLGKGAGRPKKKATKKVSKKKKKAKKKSAAA